MVEVRVETIVPAIPLRRSAYAEVAKPVLDRLLALVLLVLLAPLLAVVWLAVRLRLGSPVLFHQRRVGHHGEDFVILKFRTMHPDRRAGSSPIDFPDRRRTHKTTDDPRHTALGRFLRATSLDELPQLVNVLRGEMSLVGPRPEISEVADRYGFRHHPRHQVRPGITGLWQISEERSELLHENLDLDLEYVERVGLRTDLAVLARTADDVFRRRGA
ncbi:MAG: sugar transferase [Actinomycetota bacterium]